MAPPGAHCGPTDHGQGARGRLQRPGQSRRRRRRSVADLYAGSGALGIEALSRGAAHCTFVERDRAAVAAIDENIATLGLRDRATVVVGDAITAAPRVDADLVFADPPYELRRVAAAAPRRRGASSSSPRLPPSVDAPVDWEQGRAKRYGRTWVTFLHRDRCSRRAQLP